jgi:prevent-host-death family protein
MIPLMNVTVTATDLKHRLGEVLDRAMLGKVAIERHGRVVAYLVPATDPGVARRAKRKHRPAGLTRQQEDRLLELCASGDFRPSRWRRAGDPELLAGFAALLASVDMFDRARLFALAERLKPGMSTLQGFDDWLKDAPVEPARFLPMLKARLDEKTLDRGG